MTPLCRCAIGSRYDLKRNVGRDMSRVLANGEVTVIENHKLQRTRQLVLIATQGQWMATIDNVV